MVLTKSNISKLLFEKFKLKKKDIKQLVDLFFEEVRLSLEKGETVKLSGFGNFYLRNKETRPGRNPKTKENIAVTARRVVVFKSGQKLKNRINV
ncbi:Integration host factor subunit alpha [Buchnera aphidicola (Eriosoma lanigerum)]|uniref:integration host factor subunit alpha n=1 Tax=Buchnera aphidicola TaxID=9 RepID=UPI003463890E